MMENKGLIKYKDGQIKRIGNAINVTNKILNIESDDFIPLNICYEKEDGLISIIIPVKTCIPIQKKEVFIVHFGNEYSITIQLLQGISKKARENRDLTKFSIYNISKSLIQEVEVEIIFEIDINGILYLSTKDKRFKIEIDEYSNGLSRSEIQKMKSLK